MVQQTAGRRDQHIDAARDLDVLVAEGHAADQQRHVELVIDAILDEVFLDLRCQFAGRLKDKRAWHPGAGAALLKQRDHRQREGRRLAGAGLSDAQHVLALHHMRDGLRLDRGRGGVAGRGNGREDLVAQAQFGK